MLTCALRADITTMPLVDPPTRGIYAITPRRDPHPCAVPCAVPLLDQLTTAFASVRPAQVEYQPTESDAHAAAPPLHDGISETPHDRPEQRESIGVVQRADTRLCGRGLWPSAGQLLEVVLRRPP
ncbi:hypothetical protein GCM10010271_55230 [Streptomyces kurssanovii]|nr:hypothetical protein GCM10010271_55230 [Streptomyces kurssanovii]